MNRLYVLEGVMWLGGPKDKDARVTVDITAKELSKAENLETTPKKLALQLLFALLSREELSKGNLTIPRKSGVVLLNQTKVKAIRGKQYCSRDQKLLACIYHTHTCTYTHACTIHTYIPARLKYRFPVAERQGETEEYRWTAICQKTLNAKCRNIRDV